MSNLRARARKLRQEMTPPEWRLWRQVRNRRLLGLKFRRQVPLGRFVVDFLCEQHRLVVELDGDSHAGQQDYDRRRDIYLIAAGYRVLRIANRDVTGNLEDVLALIAEACGK